MEKEIVYQEKMVQTVGGIKPALEVTVRIQVLQLRKK